MHRLRAGLILVLTGTMLLLTACSEEDATGVLPQKSAELDSVTIEVLPEQLDEATALVSLTLDTHVTPLDMDLPEDAHLYVNGREWPAEAWEGDAAGGHHREGTLRFDASGSPSGEVRFVLDGFSDPVELTWKASDRSS